MKSSTRSYIIVITLVLISFILSFGITKSSIDYKFSNQTKKDSLSKTSYNTGGVYNYRDNNPYGSYLVGFSELTERGISNDEYIYISDYITNYVIYNIKKYNNNISFAKDSFVRKPSNGSFLVYSFKFGVGDDPKLYTVDVEYSLIKELIRISISNNANDRSSKDFRVY